MKLRLIALAGVAAVALCAPASASTYTGWYLGFGVGYGWPNLVNADTGLGPAEFAYDANVLGVLSAGYKWDQNIRTELELGYGSHSIDNAGLTGDLFG